jgi:rSAM/selenodomain-associated transferase 2/rSAM/selenodomain-associated transferase 1
MLIAKSPAKKNRGLAGRIILFCRYPIPGQTKTRLMPELGRVGAANLQRKLTETVFKTIRETASRRSLGVEVWFAGGNERRMRQWLGGDAVFLSQPQGSLGHRMRTAFEQSFRQGRRRVVLVGSDIPGVKSGHFNQAFEALGENDLVLGPSTDGGYWLVGMSGCYDIFGEVDWSTDRVFEQTIHTAKRLGLKTSTLDLLTDIDTADDLRQWRTSEAEQKPYVSVIIPCLNESKTIEASILSAQNDDAEIIVVDGGSSDDTVEKAMAAGACVESSVCGRAEQQNAGAKRARGTTLLFLHADTVLPENYIDHVFESFMDPQTAAGAFRLRTDMDKPIMKVVEFMTNLRSRHLNLPYGDQGLFVKGSVFSKIGGFPLVPVAEDLLLIRRLAGKGNIRIVPAQVITSARRWRKQGILRTTMINQIIAVGCLTGVPPRFLARLYRDPPNS